MPAVPIMLLRRSDMTRGKLYNVTNAIIIIFLAHQHKACRQLKIKQEMTAVGDFYTPGSMDTWD